MHLANSQAVAPEFEGSLPLGMSWAPLSLDANECRQLMVLLSKCCRLSLGVASANSARQLLAKLSSHLTVADRAKIAEIEERNEVEAAATAAAAEVDAAAAAAVASASTSAATAASLSRSPAMRAHGSPARSPADSPASRRRMQEQVPPLELLPPADGAAAEEDGPPRVRALLHACKVPVGKRQLAVRAVLKLSIPRHRRASSTLRWRASDGQGGDQNKR